jgi:hypothetical protein
MKMMNVVSIASDFILRKLPPALSELRRTGRTAGISKVFLLPSTDQSDHPRGGFYPPPRHTQT